MGQVQKNMSRSNQGFRRRTRSVNSIIEKWPLVCGTGSLLEAHLVGRLGLAEALPGLVGCGTNEQEVWQLSTMLERQGLVILSDSIAADWGVALIRRLQQRRFGHRVLLLVGDCRPGVLQLPPPSGPSRKRRWRLCGISVHTFLSTHFD